MIPLSANAWKFTNGKEASTFVDAVEVAAGRAKRSVTVVASPLPARFQAIVEQNLKDGSLWSVSSLRPARNGATVVVAGHQWMR